MSIQQLQPNSLNTLSGLTLSNSGLPDVGGELLNVAPLETSTLPSLSMQPSESFVPQSEAALGILPERNIYKANQTLWNWRPFFNAFLALLTPGKRHEKFERFASELSSTFIYQKGVEGVLSFQNRMYEKHPRVAEWMNRHPIITSIGGLVVASIAASPLYALTHRVMRWGQGTSLGQKIFGTVAYNPLTNTVAAPIERGVTSLGSKLRNSSVFKTLAPVAGIGLTLGGLAFVGATLFRLVQDTGKFGRAYNEARDNGRDIDPYELRANVLHDLYQPSAPQ